jgi:hypothetical protein
MFFQPETLQFFVGGPQSREKQQEEDCCLLGKPGTQDGSRGLPESAYNGKEEFIGVCGKRIQFKKFYATLEHMNLDYIFICILG